MASVASQTTAASKPEPVVFHPTFPHDDDAEVVLVSSDKIHYRMQRYTLCTTCGFFSSMFSLPQSKNEDGNCDANTTTLEMHESSDILTLFLLLISGLAPEQPISSFSIPDIERLLVLAECMDAPGPLYVVRSSLSSSSILEHQPLRAFAWASHFGWQEERRLASTHCLRLTSEELDVQSSSNFLSSKHLIALLALRRQRRNSFKLLLDSRERFSAGNTENFLCTTCGVTPIDNSSWHALKHALVIELDRRPLGDEVTGRAVNGVGGTGEVMGMAIWPQAKKCWMATCAKEGCIGSNYDKMATLKQVRRCIESLPSHVEDELLG